MSGRRLTFTAAAVVSLIFVLAMVFVAGASFSVAYAASTTNSVATSGELSGYDGEGTLVYTEDAPMTGASYVIDEEVTDTQSGGTESNAAIIYEQTVTISLTGDMLAAVKSSRLSASLVMNGNLDYLISEGTFAYAGYTVRAEGALSGYLKTADRPGCQARAHGRRQERLSDHLKTYRQPPRHEQKYFGFGRFDRDRFRRRQPRFRTSFQFRESALYDRFFR